MAGSFSKIYYHLVFSTKDRLPLLRKHIKDDVYKYISGIIKSEDGFVYAIGGTENHIHLLCTLSTKKPLTEMLQRIKGHSSKLINGSLDSNTKFNWQSGNGIFTVSHSQVDSVKKYILNQEEHHRTMSFKEEFRILLQKHNIDFREEYIWK